MSEETVVTAESGPEPEAESEATPSSVWKSLSAVELYDRLTEKGAKLGVQANKLIRLLKKHNFVPDGAASTVGKTKRESR